MRGDFARVAYPCRYGWLTAALTFQRAYFFLRIVGAGSRRRQTQGIGALFVQPLPDAWMGVILDRLGNDIRIQHDHSILGGSAVTLSRP